MASHTTGFETIGYSMQHKKSTVSSAAEGQTSGQCEVLCEVRVQRVHAVKGEDTGDRFVVTLFC
jgi:hypothetical protein